MAAQWFTKKPDGQRRGPFLDAELKRKADAGELARTDLIWCEGLDMAIPAASLPGLFPPMPQMQPMPPVPQAPSQVRPQAPQQAPKRPAPHREEIEEEEEDAFSWYRPGDSRAPITINFVPFWQLVHSIGRRNKWFYTLLPLTAALPMGVIVGVVTSYMPLIIINYVIVIALAVVFGESVYECSRLKNGGRPLEGPTKFRTMMFGAAAAMVLAYFYTVGNFYTDLSRAGLGDKMSSVDFFLPGNVARYMNLKLQHMVVAKFTQTDGAGPDRILNGLTIGLEYLFLIGVVISVSGGGKREKTEDT